MELSEHAEAIGDGETKMKTLTLSVVAFALSATATVAIAQSATGLATPAAADPAARESMMDALKKATPGGPQSNTSGSGSQTSPPLAAAAATPAAKSMVPAK